jgi:predicted nucleic acid-binding protein
LKVIIDTSIWSLALRRDQSQDNSIVNELQSLINDFRVQLIGPIRQELLSGIISENQFKKLKSYLRSFPDYQIQSHDFEIAAQFFNQCRASGIQGSNTDFLICAVSVNNHWQIFTSDQDFLHFQKTIPIQLYETNS